MHSTTTHIVVAQRRLEQRHPRALVRVEQCLLHLRMPLIQKVERLREPKQHNQIDDAEREHVAGDHREDHRDKRSGQPDGARKEHEQKPAARHGEHEDRLLGVGVAEQPERNAGEQQQIGQQKDRLGRCVGQLLQIGADALVLDLVALLEQHVAEHADQRDQFAHVAQDRLGVQAIIVVVVVVRQYSGVRRWRRSPGRSTLGGLAVLLAARGHVLGGRPQVDGQRQEQQVHEQDEQPLEELVLREGFPLLFEQPLNDAAVEHVQVLLLGAVEDDEQRGVPVWRIFKWRIKKQPTNPNSTTHSSGRPAAACPAHSTDTRST